MTHALKTAPAYFDHIDKGQKTFELRKDDRPFELSDRLLLQEWNGKEGYTGREIERRITYILRDFTGLRKGYCILGLEEVES